MICLAPGKDVVSFVATTFINTSSKAQHDQLSESEPKYPVDLYGEPDFEAYLLGNGFNPPLRCTVSSLDGNNWALMLLQNTTIVHRVALMREKNSISRFLYPVVCLKQFY